jgi:outer membrane protein TolC
MIEQHGNSPNSALFLRLAPGLAALLLAALAAVCRAQQPAPETPPAITLEEALHRAQANEPAFRAAAAESGAAHAERWIARGGLLPSVSYQSSALYTQTNHGQSTPRFIANNANHEYVSQAAVSETLSLASLAQVRKADAEAARAAAELEIARRGLVVAVTGLYDGLSVAEAKLVVDARALDEAAGFTTLTTKREAAREAAHADVVKAQLEEQKRKRELSNARVEAEKARLELAVLLFPDPRTPFTLVADGALSELPTRAEAAQRAARNNPELKSALATLASSSADLLQARAALLPEFGATFNYGIDAQQYAVNAPDHSSNLGLSAGVSVNLPVWDWLSSERKVHQAALRRDAAKVALTAAQRRAIAHLDEVYSEAAAAREQLASLDESVATAEESLRLTRLRYTAGEATVLEVVDAQGAFVDAENAREEGRVRARVAEADLGTMTGRQ